VDSLDPKNVETWRLEAFTNADKIKFTELFATGKSLQDCCSSVGINRTTYEYHHRKDRWFKALLEAARAMQCDDLEAVMLQQGKTPKGFADRSEYLKAYRPEIFGRKHDNATIDVTINVNPELIRQAEIRQKAIEAEIGRPNEP
jgi:hypothetical protein